MDFGLEGKIAVVTGGATGIGHAIARTFHEEGATVLINGRNQEKLSTAAAAIGKRAHGVVADLLTMEGAERHSPRLPRSKGPVSFLVKQHRCLRRQRLLRGERRALDRVFPAQHHDGGGVSRGSS